MLNKKLISTCFTIAFVFTGTLPLSAARQAQDASAKSPTAATVNSQEVSEQTSHRIMISWPGSSRSAKKVKLKQARVQKSKPLAGFPGRLFALMAKGSKADPANIRKAIAAEENMPASVQSKKHSGAAKSVKRPVIGIVIEPACVRKPLVGTTAGAAVAPAAARQSAPLLRGFMTDSHQDATSRAAVDKLPVVETARTAPELKLSSKDQKKATSVNLSQLPRRLLSCAVSTVVCTPQIAVRKTREETASGINDLVGSSKNPLLRGAASTISFPFGIASGVVQALSASVIDGWRSGVDTRSNALVAGRGSAESVR